VGFAVGWVVSRPSEDQPTIPVLPSPVLPPPASNSTPPAVFPQPFVSTFQSLSCPSSPVCGEGRLGWIDGVTEADAGPQVAVETPRARVTPHTQHPALKHGIPLAQNLRVFDQYVSSFDSR
jgi:hypothetical protein